MNLSSSTMDQRPAVWLFVLQPVPEETIMPILWGLEEEGIPAELSVTLNCIHLLSLN